LSKYVQILQFFTYGVKWALNLAFCSKVLCSRQWVVKDILRCTVHASKLLFSRCGRLN
jgi:hypothetical protein